MIYVLLVILTLTGCALYRMLQLQKDDSSFAPSNSREKMYGRQEMIQIMKEKEKYEALWKEESLLLKDEKKRNKKLSDANHLLGEEQKLISLELKRYDTFLNTVFYKLLNLKDDNSEFEKIYAEKSNMAMRATTMIVLDSLLEKNNLFINKLITVQEKLEKYKSYNESEILDILDKLGEEIVQNLEKYEFDSENIAEQLKEMSTLFYGASSGYYSFIVPSVGSSFLNDKMQGQFIDVRNGDIIKSVENWGIKVQNNTVYKARVKC